MKHKLAVLGFVGLVSFGLPAFSSEMKKDNQQEPEKTRHIKMMKIENGEKMELDTVIAGDDVFIWNGDTINPVKHGKKFGHADFGRMRRIGVETDNGEENVMIFKHKNGGEPMIWQMDMDNDIEMFSQADGDSVQKKIIIHKRMKDGNEEDHLVYMNGPNRKHFAPMPPRPPMPHMKMLKKSNSGRIIDLNGSDIISYKKKELSGDREKIEIIRKKSESPENMTFDFNFDDQLMPPQIPEVPGISGEYNDVEQNRKVIEKKIKVDGENEKKSEVEVESNENK